MDSNTAYHFSRLLETTPYLGHCWRVVKMERYRVCAARRKKREKNFRETRIVTRHRATARPYYVPRASNFTRASLRDVSLPFPFFFTISLQGKAFHDAQTSLPRGTEEIDRRKLYPLLSVSLDEPVIRRIEDLGTRNRPLCAFNRWDWSKRMNDGRAHLGRPRFTFNRFHRERDAAYCYIGKLVSDTRV